MADKELVSLQATVYGYVQGVFFRAFVSQQAEEINLTGYVRNLPSGAVEVAAEGERGQLERLLDRLRVGPPAARVERVTASWAEYSGAYSGFRIRY
jgi:acylphosphatase